MSGKRKWTDDVLGKLPTRIWMPDDGDYSLQRKMPTGIILHSGERHDGVAEYAEHEPDGRKISYHFAWSKKHQRLVQMVSLHHRAWHAGPRWNHALGIALSGPWSQEPRRQEEMEDLQMLLAELQIAFGGGLTWWRRHSDVEVGKRDPGPGLVAIEILAHAPWWRVIG